MTVTYTVAAERHARRKPHWTDWVGLSTLSIVATSCVAMMAIALAYAGRTNVFEHSGHAAAAAPINLNTVADAKQIEAVMSTVFSDANDRQLAADRLFRFLGDER